MSQSHPTVYVTLIPFDASKQDVEEHFKGCGVRQCRMVFDRDTVGPDDPKQSLP